MMEFEKHICNYLVIMRNKTLFQKTFQKFQNDPDKKLWIIWSVLLGLVFMLTRLLFLDADLPPYGIAFYSPIDEGVYGELALNYINYGTIDPNQVLNGLQFKITGQMINNVMGNLAVWVGLVTLGDNYYGFRIPYVVVNLINTGLFILILNTLRKVYGKNVKNDVTALLAVVTYVVFDFIFIMSGRVVEPSAIRTIFVLTAFLIVLCVRNYVLKGLALGIVIGVAIAFVYLTNTFLLLAVFLWCLLLIWKEGIKIGARVFIACAIGFFIMFICGELYYYLTWNRGIIASALETLVSFSNNESGQYNVGGLKLLIKHAAKFLSANSVLYNLPIFYIFIVCSGLSFKRIVNDENIAFAFSVLVALGIQTLVTEDYIVRKFVMIYPIVWVVMYYFYLIRTEFRENICHLNISHLKLMTLLICGGIIVFRLFVVRDGSIYDFSHVDKLVVEFGLFLVFVDTFISMGTRTKAMGTSNGLYPFSASLLIVLLSGAFLVNVTMGLRHIYGSPTFTDKAIMIALNDYNGKYLLGEYGGVYSLYNATKPVVNDREQLAEYISKDKNLLYFDYADDYIGSMREFWDNDMFYGYDYTVVPLVRYDRDFQVYGSKRPVGLLRRISKAKVDVYYEDLYAYYHNIYIIVCKIAGTQGDPKDNVYQLNEEPLENFDLKRWEVEAIRHGCFNYYRELRTNGLNEFSYQQAYKKKQEILSKIKEIRKIKI